MACFWGVRGEIRQDSPKLDEKLVDRIMEFLQCILCVLRQHEPVLLVWRNGGSVGVEQDEVGALQTVAIVPVVQ
jgi:hypothetical protein